MFLSGGWLNKTFSDKWWKKISAIPKPELRGDLGGNSLTKPPFGVTSADGAIICPGHWHFIKHSFGKKKLVLGCLGTDNVLQATCLWPLPPVVPSFCGWFPPKPLPFVRAQPLGFRSAQVTSSMWYLLRLTPLETKMTLLQNPYFFNRKYIFKWWIFHCHFSFREGKRPNWLKGLFDTSPTHQPKITKISSYLERIHEDPLILYCLEIVDFRSSDPCQKFTLRRMTIDTVSSDFGGFVGFKIANPHVFRSHSILVGKFTNVGFSITMSVYNCISHLQGGYT